MRNIRSDDAVPPASEARDWSNPHIPDHTLLRKIGSGSYGEVWLARNIMGTYRAVKIVYRRTFSSEKPYEREFAGIKKFEPLSRSHEGLVEVLHVGRSDAAGYFYYVMELADDVRLDPLAGYGGALQAQSYRPQTLAAKIGLEGRVDPDDCLLLALSLTSALAHLHEHGLVHRDIKPSNIIFVNGIPKLADIGLVASANEARSCVGTEGYISPEGPGSTPADIYSLGKVLYECMTGKDRFEFPRLPTRLADGSAHSRFLELNEVIIKACADAVPCRYPSAAEMHADLVLIQSGKSVRRLHRLERRLAWSLKLGLLILMVGGATAYYVRQQQKAAIATLERQLLSQLELQRVDGLLAEDRTRAALAYLGRLLRRDPNNRVAASRLLSILNFRTLALPQVSHREQVYLARFHPQNERIVTASADHTARVWDSRTGQSLAELRHDGLVYFADFNRTGSSMVTASADGTARLWNAQDGRPLAEAMRHHDLVYMAHFNAAGDWLITASADGTARIWETRSGKPLADPLRHADSVRCAQFSANGMFVVTGCADMAAYVWDWRAGKRSEPLPHEGAVVCAQFSPDDRQLATASLDGTARVWDWHSGKPITEPLRHEAAVLTVQFSPRGDTIVTASLDGTARIWHALTGELRQTVHHSGGVYSARFSPDATRIITASHDKTARVWDVRTGLPLTESLRHEGLVGYAEFSPAGDRVVTASADGGSCVWNLRRPKEIVGPLPQSAKVRLVEFRPDSDRLLTVSGETTNSGAQLWHLRGGKMIAALAAGQPVKSAALSADGLRALIISSAGAATVWDARTGKPACQLTSLEPAQSAHFSPSGNQVLTVSVQGQARLFDARTGNPVSELAQEEPVQFTEFNSRGDRLIVAAFGGPARIYDALSGKLLAPLNHDRASIHSAQFSPLDEVVLTISSEGSVRLWDARSGNLITQLRTEDPVQLARFSPDGRRIACASVKTVRLWDRSAGMVAGEVMQHRAPVRSLEFSAAGDYLLTTSTDGTARLWDGQTGQPLTDLLPHERPVRSAHFSRDDQRLVTVSDDLRVRIWTLTAPSLPVPSWLPDLAEAIAGERLDDRNVLTPVSATEFFEATKSATPVSPSGFWRDWRRDFLATRDL